MHDVDHDHCVLVGVGLLEAVELGFGLLAEFVVVVEDGGEDGVQLNQVGLEVLRGLHLKGGKLKSDKMECPSLNSLN